MSPRPSSHAWRLAAVIAAVAATACTDPTIDVVFDYRGRTDLAGEVTRVELAVYTLADVDPATVCDDIALGRYRADALDAALETVTRGARARGGAFPPLRLDDVPRLADKQVVVTGYDAGNQIIAGGCAAVGAIEADLEVAIPIAPAILTQVLPSAALLPSLRLGADPPTTIQPIKIFARERLSPDRVMVGVRGLDAYLRVAPRGGADQDCEYLLGPTITPPGAAPDGDLPPDAELFTLVPPAPAPPPPRDLAGVCLPPAGPVEVLIRAPWSEQVHRIPAFVPTISRGATFEPLPSALDPDWVILPIDNGLRAVGLVRPLGGPSHVEIFLGTRGDPPMVRRTGQVAATGVEALGQLAGKVVTRDASGWMVLDLDGGPPRWRQVTPSPGRPATTIVSARRCGGQPAGLLVEDGSSTVVGFALSADETAIEVAQPDSPVDRLARLLNALPGPAPRLLATSCLRVGDAGEDLVLAYEQLNPDGRRVLYLAVAGPKASPLALPVATPFVGPISPLPVVGASPESPDKSLVGAVATPSGYRALSYRLRRDPELRLVPDGVVDHPLPGRPSALVALYMNDDDLADTIAIATFDGQVTLSATIGSDDPDRLLTAMTAVLGEAVAPRLTSVRLFSDDRDDPMMLTRFGVLVSSQQAQPPTTKPMPMPMQ